MRCPYCGEDNPDGAFVCEHCGKPLKRAKREYVEQLEREEEENSDDFFEKNIYHDEIEESSDELQEENLDEKSEESYDDEHTAFYTRETPPETAFTLEDEETSPKGFAFNEEEPYENIEEEEEHGLKLYLSRLKNYLFPPKEDNESTDEETIEEEIEQAPRHTAKSSVGHKVKNFILDRDEDEEMEDEEATKIYHPGDPIVTTKKREFKRIPFKVLGLILVVALVFGGIVMSKKKSSTTSSTTSSSSTSKKSASTTTTISSTPSISSVSASSTLEQTGYNYAPSLLIDGNPQTAWNEGANGDGIGESVTFTLKTKSKVTSASIYNGYDKNYSIYYKNNRVKACYFIFDDGKEYRTLNDYYNRAQKVTFYKVHTTKTVKIKIVSVYRGRSFRDTCLSEVSFA